MDNSNLGRPKIKTSIKALPYGMAKRKRNWRKVQNRGGESGLLQGRGKTCNQRSSPSGGGKSRRKSLGGGTEEVLTVMYILQGGKNYSAATENYG